MEKMIENNDFLVTNQFQLEGLKNPIFPDIMIFVNGIPLVVMELKNATDENANPERDSVDHRAISPNTLQYIDIADNTSAFV